MIRRHRLLVLSAVFLGLSGICPAGVQAADEAAVAELRNTLFRLEKHLVSLSQSTSIDAVERVRKAEHLQAEIKAVKKRLAGAFPPADLALGETVDAVREHGAAWILRYLSHGKYTGRKSEHHKPLEAVDIPGKNPELAGRAALPLLGYPLMVILSYDAISREAYRRFIPEMEKIVREMEKRSGKPCDFWDRKPSVIANDLGWDVDRFWSFAQECAGQAVDKYFWNHPPEEIRIARNLVSLVIVTGFLNNVTIDVEGDKETQSKRAFWRANAAPWFQPDKSRIGNKFKIFHHFTHAWLTFLKCLNDARYDDGRILDPREERRATPGMIANAFRFSNVSGVGYELISTFAGTKHGFLETTAVNELPKPLKKVAQMLHLKNVVLYEACHDIADNRQGAWFGAALFLSRNPLTLSRPEEAKKLVQDWHASAGKGGRAPEPETAGPENGLPKLLQGDRVSLFELNTAEGKELIRKNLTRDLHRGTGTFSPAGQAAAELQAFKNLLGEDIQCYNLRQLYSAAAAGQSLDQAYRIARQGHARLVAQHFTEGGAEARAAIFRDLYSNEAVRPAGDGYNHEADFIYVTRRADIAGCYGPVVLQIREREPRGFDLNRIAATSGYYAASRFLKNAIRGRWRTLIGDYILDDEEYLIPSYVPANEIVGVTVLAPKAVVIKSHIDAADKDFAIAVKAPPVQRRYEKRMENGFLVIRVFDGENRLMARLSEGPTDGPEPTSPHKLPATVLAAWSDFQRRNR